MKTILLAAIGITIAIMLLREPPPTQPPPPAKVAAPAPAPAAPKQAKVMPKPVVQMKRIPAPLVVKGVEAEPEFVPVATAPVATPVVTPVEAPVVAAAPVREPPNSVFGWGPWAGGQAAPDAGGGGTASQRAARTEGLPPTVSVASSVPTGNGAAVVTPSVTLPPVTLPPPQLGGIKNGHGFGDRNHVHRHKHHPDLAGARGRDR